MPDSSEVNIATAEALTLLLHNQHPVCAAIVFQTDPSQVSNLSRY